MYYVINKSYYKLQRSIHVRLNGFFFLSFFFFLHSSSIDKHYLFIYLVSWDVRGEGEEKKRTSLLPSLKCIYFTGKTLTVLRLRFLVQTWIMQSVFWIQAHTILSLLTMEQMFSRLLNFIVSVIIRPLVPDFFFFNFYSKKKLIFIRILI